MDIPLNYSLADYVKTGDTVKLIQISRYAVVSGFKIGNYLRVGSVLRDSAFLHLPPTLLGHWMSPLDFQLIKTKTCSAERVEQFNDFVLMLNIVTV